MIMCAPDEWIDDDIEPPSEAYALLPRRWCQRCRKSVVRNEWDAHIVTHDHAYAKGKDLKLLDENMKRKLDRLLRDVIGEA